MRDCSRVGESACNSLASMYNALLGAVMAHSGQTSNHALLHERLKARLQK